MNAKNLKTLTQVSEITGVSLETLLAQFNPLSPEEKRLLLKDLKKTIKKAGNNKFLLDFSKFLFPL